MAVFKAYSLRFSWEERGLKNNIPDFKPHSLKLPFLSLLFVFICAIIGLLEHMIRTLPAEANRTKIPQDFVYRPRPIRHRTEEPTVAVDTAPQKRERTNLLSPKQTHLNHATHTAIIARTTPETRAIKVAAPDPDPRPPSSHYANKEPITTYVTWVNSWYYEWGDHPTVDSRTPLFPGEDPNGKCIYNYQGIVMTTNSSGCRALLGLGDRQPPSGWKRGTWIMEDIWFPKGGGCDENYDDWYSGWPSNQSSAFPQPTRSLVYPSYFESLMIPMARCTWYNGVTPTISRPPYTATVRPSNPWFDAVLHHYVAVDFPRGPDGRIIWPVVETGTGGAVASQTVQKLTQLRAIRPDKGIYHTVGVYLETSTERTTSSVGIKTTEGSTQETSGNTFGEATEQISKETFQTTHHSHFQEASSGKALAQTTPELSQSSLLTSHETPIPTTTTLLQTKTTEEAITETPRPSQSTAISVNDRPPSEQTSSKIDHLMTASDSRSSIFENKSGEEITTTQVLTTTPYHTAITESSQFSTQPYSTVQPHVQEEVRGPNFPDRYFYIPDTRFGTPGETRTFQAVFSAFTREGSTRPESTLVQITTLPQAWLLPVPVIMATAQISMVLTDAQGQATATVTDFGGDLVEGSTTITTLTNPQDGSPTATITIQIPTGASVVLTKNNPNDGKPTATVTLFPIIPNIPNATLANIVVPTDSTYFLVYFLPIFLTALLLLPMQAIDAEIKLFMPFRLLTRPDGSTDALPMRTGGVIGRYNGLRLLLFRYKDPLSLLGDLMILCTTAIVSLSGETIGLKLRGTCIQHNLNTCFTTVAVFPPMARAAQGLLSALLVLILVLAIMLSRWRTGIPAHPTSIAAVCALLQVPGTRGLIQAAQLTTIDSNGGRLDKEIAERYRKIRFRLGRVACERNGGRRTTEYGLVGVRDGDDGDTPVAARIGARTLMDGSPETPERMKQHIPFWERVDQGLYLFFLCGLLALILYYELTVFEDPAETPFEWFMDSQLPGPRVLFTGFGVLVSFMWDHLFSNFTKKATYRLMAQRNQPAALSILQTRPTNVFTGLWRAIRQRDSLMGSIAIAGILSKFLPLFLASIPFAAAQTWVTHEICTWGAVSILIVMIIVLLSHAVIVKWPYMPAAAPDSLACCVYYVCDSAMLRDFEEMSMLARRERDSRVERMGRMYRFGWMTGVSGEKRIGVDYPVGEQGFRLRSLGVVGFGVSGGKKW